MKQQDKPTYNGLTFDSSGEMHFYWWCEELMYKGIITGIENQPCSFDLSSDVKKLYTKEMKKIENKTLEYSILKGHSYTSDFRIIWSNDEPSAEKFHTTLSLGKVFDSKKCLDKLFSNELKGILFPEGFTPISFIEVKPSFDQNNMTRLAVLNQKWVMEKYGLFINIVIPEKLFQKTFTPKRYLTCDKSSARRKIKYSNIISLEDFLLSS